MTAKKRPAGALTPTGQKPETPPLSEGNEPVKSTPIVPAAPSAGRNRVTNKTPIHEVFSLWLAGDPDILRECDEFYKAWKLTPDALKIAARMASSS